MRVSMKCTGNDFPPAARASACGEGVIYGDTVDVDGLPASVQCARAAESFFNASLSAAGTPESSPLGEEAGEETGEEAREDAGEKADEEAGVAL